MTVVILASWFLVLSDFLRCCHREQRSASSGRLWSFSFWEFTTIFGASARWKVFGSGARGHPFIFWWLWRPTHGTLSLPRRICKPLLGLPLTIFWVLLITNAFNLIDGLDGLAAGSALFSAAVIFILSLFAPNPMVSFLAIALAGAILGFLRFNFHPASIFLGIRAVCLLDS